MAVTDSRRPQSGYRGRGLHRQIVETLAAAIVSGELSEGDLLDVDDLRRRFDVSRTVVRESLKVLAAKGMVDARQNRGTFVRPRDDWALLDPDLVRWQSAMEFSETMMRSLRELRILIEPGAARLAARRANADDRERLRRALDDYAAAADDPARAADADVAFHESVLRATKNELLVRLRNVLGVALSVRDRQVVPRVMDDPIPSHREVLDAIVAGDPEAAERAMREVVIRAGTHEEIAQHAVRHAADGPG